MRLQPVDTPARRPGEPGERPYAEAMPVISEKRIAGILRLIEARPVWASSGQAIPQAAPGRRAGRAA